MKITRVSIFFLFKFIINVDDYLDNMVFHFYTYSKYIVKSKSKHLK